MQASNGHKARTWVTPLYMAETQRRLWCAIDTNKKVKWAPAFGGAHVFTQPLVALAPQGYSMQVR